uniref:Uncharacterized protein n=1 Tax=Biomphalaria glabrata TaxID=6526 RepID=A0A2C9LDM1_BIOGL
MDPTILPYGLHDDLRLRLEKLSRSYDLATMKIFMAVESLGDNNVYSTYTPVWHHDQTLQKRLDKLSDEYDTETLKVYMATLALGQETISHVYDPAIERRELWETFLIRREACRLDLARHEKLKEKYHQFLTEVGREEQGKQFFHSIIALLKSKGAVDIFRQTSSKYFPDLESTFCGLLCKLFDKKLESWFDNFEAVNVRLTAHVKVSNLVRVLTGQVDLICRKGGILYAINVKVTGMPTPRPMDVNELCLVKAMVIQNGLADPDAMICGLLVCHLGEDRPVLRLWEYRPTRAMDIAIQEADVDNMIEAGKHSKLHELWPQNVCPPGVASLTAREAFPENPAPPKYTDVKPANHVTGNINNSTNQNYNDNDLKNRKTPSIVQTTK